MPEWLHSVVATLVVGLTLIGLAAGVLEVLAYFTFGSL
jgi:hypothetical protein